MQITSEQVQVWRDNPENTEWEAVIGPCYKREGMPADIEELFLIAEANGLGDLRLRYKNLNPGQVAMNVRNMLRPLWRKGTLKLIPR